MCNCERKIKYKQKKNKYAGEKNSRIFEGLIQNHFQSAVEAGKKEIILKSQAIGDLLRIQVSINPL